MSDWKDKVVLVTGGAAGLGRAIATAFAEVQARIVLADRDADRLAEAVAAFGSQGFQAHGVTGDVTRQADVERLIQEAVEHFGRLDVLVNNAGRSSRGEAIQTTAEQFLELLELNFLAMVRCTRAAAPQLLANRGHVVNIGSLSAKTASRYLGAYPASKFPVAAYSQQLRLELAPQGVHVLLVCPGPLAREDAGRRYDAQAADLPDTARRPGGGVKLKGISPPRLARKIVQYCQRRRPELVMPARARVLFALAQLSPTLGDWILKKMT